MKPLIIIATLLLYVSFPFANPFSTKIILTPRDNRQELLTAIKTFAADVSSMDVRRLKKHFSFPLADSDIWYLCGTNDSVFVNPEANYRPFTESDFDKYYREIFKLEDCNMVQLFKTVKLDSLADKPSVEAYPHVTSGDPCYYIYTVTVNDEQHEVTFQYGTNTRTDYAGDGQLECVEFSHFWVFKLVNGMLVFKKLQIAG